MLLYEGGYKLGIVHHIFLQIKEAVDCIVRYGLDLEQWYLAEEENHESHRNLQKDQCQYPRELWLQ